MEILMSLTVSLNSAAVRCSLIRLNNCIVVRPMYPAPQMQVNSKMHIDLDSLDNIF